MRVVRNCGTRLLEMSPMVWLSGRYWSREITAWLFIDGIAVAFLAMSADEQRVAATSAAACTNTPSGLRIAPQSVLDDLRAAAKTFRAWTSIRYAYNHHYAPPVDLVFDLTVQQRVLFDSVTTP